MPLSHKDVAEIIKIIDASALDEFVIELPDIKLVIRRRGAHAEAGATAIPVSAPESSIRTSAAPPERTPAAAPAAQAFPRTDGAVEVRAPMVGTFYRGPSPKDPPFVEVGGVVKPGQPLCLIEVMKLYTTLEAKQAGRVVDIPPANGALVEYDQVLFVIEPL
ncbi:MAG: acetyl-CoA carboxylase biotin carboxyl carrier protein [Pseudomonadota bacterium]